jgi:FkbM family methyltransferase
MPKTNSDLSVRNPIEQGLIGGFLIKRELRRIKKLPRYEPFTTDIFGPVVKGVDGRSFYYSFREIFRDHIYEFKTNTASPRILDVGSNIGLSLLFFKHQYPNCKLTGFEPDPNVFQTAQHNLDSLGLTDIDLLQKAAWIEATALSFEAEGADAGHLTSSESSNAHSFSVNAVDLSSFLQEPIDFLKMDIEGAEVDVLMHCVNDLSNVSNLFVEYHSFANQPQRFHELARVLTDAGFRYQIHTQFASKSPLCERELQLDMDLQLNVFAYR